ncbi:MAG: RimK-like ATPgrasp N-terminal domain-containing protein [Candidatus Bathyarchaeota archaeon]|nr:RimK-like ATPgrasp N-terminal domain-containing protein [Candidatus Bathyarchaeota archaeon]
MLVVSNIDLKTSTPITKPSTFLKSSLRGFVLNVNNDYRYMKTGYYVSLHAEVLGDEVVPTTENALDAYRTPILLTRAAKNGTPTVPFIVTDSVRQIMAEFAFPVVVFAVNPFSFNGFQTAKNRTALYRAVKSLGMNYRYAVCVQPLRGEFVSVKSFFGECNPGDGKVKAVAKKVYETFNVPVCKLHLQCFDGEAYLCGLQPLRMEELTPSDVDLLSKMVSRFSGKGWSG